MNDAEKRASWVPRQEAKIERALFLLEQTVARQQWLHGNAFGLADVSAGYALGYLDAALARLKWRERYPRLTAYAERLMARPSFKAAV